MQSGVITVSGLIRFKENEIAPRSYESHSSPTWSIGVSEGLPARRLRLIGVGYRAEKKGSTRASASRRLLSPESRFEDPAGIEVEVAGQNTVIVKGIDKQ